VGSSVVHRPSSEDRSPRQYRIRRRRIDRALAWGLPVLLVAAWQIGASTHMFSTTFFPAPSQIWSAGVDLIRDGTLQDAVFYSGKNVIAGFLIGSFAGFAVGGILGTVRPARVAFQPLLYSLWTVPKLSLLPLLLLILGFGAKPQIALIAINAFFLIAIPTTAAFSAVPLSYREAAQSFGASRWQMIRHVLLPAAIPQSFVALRIAAGASILVMVGAEFVQGSKGIGRLIWQSWSLFMVDKMYVGIVTVSVAGVLFTNLIVWIGRRITPWVEEH
jgi:NitT/TauT family transport system permease protein/sulfonate transport system permease protein